MGLLELMNFADFAKHMEKKKNQTLGEGQTPGKERIQTHGKEKEKKTRKFPTPRPTPLYKLSMRSVVWNISIGQLGYMSCCAPPQLLHTCSFAEYDKLKKVFDFLATIENISVINILLVLNPKHSSYWEEN